MEEDVEQEAEAGKSTFSPILHGKEATSDDAIDLPLVSSQVVPNASIAGKAGDRAPFSQGRYLVGYDAADELHDAELRCMNIDQWWAWRQANHYDVLQCPSTPEPFPPTPE